MSTANTNGNPVRITTNPALGQAALGRAGCADSPANAMTVKGTALKTVYLLGILLAVAAYTWSQTLPALAETGFATGRKVEAPSGVYGFILVGCLAGFVVALATIFNPRLAPSTAPVYAALEGLTLGGLSALYEYSYPGIAVQSVGLAVGTLLVLLALYTTGLIKVTGVVRGGVIAALGAICLVYLADIVLGLYGVELPYLHQTGWLGIGFSVFVVIIAVVNLTLDFDMIEQGVKRSAPREFEWYAAFGLLVSLVWLYLEILRLLYLTRKDEKKG